MYVICASHVQFVMSTYIVAQVVFPSSANFTSAKFPVTRNFFHADEDLHKISLCLTKGQGDFHRDFLVLSAELYTLFPEIEHVIIGSQCLVSG